MLFRWNENKPRIVTQRNTSLFIHNNHFCLTWKSNGISFNQAMEEELIPNFKVVDNDKPDKQIEHFVKCE